MKKISLKTIYKTLLVSCLITTFSCKKTFDQLPKDTVDIKNAYQNVYDANAAVIGIYGKLMTLADRYIVLNELRADLVSPTVNADTYLKQLDEHTETTDNPWADPKPWYSLIMNMNDALAHFDDMYKNGRLNTSDYQQRYADIGALRCWVYLELGIQYGNQVRYVTDPLATMDDLKDTWRYPPITFADLLTKLIAFMHDINYMDAYSLNNPITGSTNSSLNVTVDGQNTGLFFINKYVLRGDLNLWGGAYEPSRYVDASTWYRTLIDVNDANLGGANVGNGNNLIYWLERYKVVAPGGFGDISQVSTGGLSISYQSPPGVPNPSQTDNTLWDSNTLGWRQIFGDPSLTTNSLDEIIWQLPFVNNFAPVDPFIDLFSPRGGKYLLKPSQAMMNMWNAAYYPDAVQVDGRANDARGQLAVKTLDGQLVNMKQLYYYLAGSSLTPTNPLQKQGKWTLMRGGAYLEHFAEAATEDPSLIANGPKVGYALLNRGVADVFNAGSTTITPFGFPYNFDARSGGPQALLTSWMRQAGTRTRARLANLPTTVYASRESMEDALILENARELGFEGYRWGDLVRISLRRRDPSFLASRVRDKLIAAGNPGAAAAAYSKLTQVTTGTDGRPYYPGFYMPFKL